MGIREKVSFWRGVGTILNTETGAKMMEATGGLVNRVAGLSGPNLTDNIPWTTSSKPLPETSMAVVNTAGIYLEGDRPFDIDTPLGDPSFREIPSDFEPSALRIAHAHYTHRYFEQDYNVLMPIDHLRALEGAKIIRVAPRFFSFGFGGTLTKPYVAPPDGTAHQVARKLKEDGADIVVFVPA